MYLMADVGGTKTRIACSDNFESFNDPIIIDTPHAYDAGLEALVSQSKKLSRGEPIDRIVVGIAGTISADHHRALSTPHLEWHGKPLAMDLEAALGGTAHVENDVALCGLGEAHFGAGRGAPIMAYLTVSTGVNGVRIVDGLIDRAAQGFEIGGQYVSYQPPCTIESLISGTAVRERTGKHPRDLGHDWGGWEELAKIAAFGLYNTISHWSPDRVVIGGSMMNEIGISIDAIRRYLAAINTKYSALPELTHSALGDFGGLWGGMARAKQLSTTR